MTVLAGGTDVYPAKAARAGWGDMRHKPICSTSPAVPGLRGIAEEARRWRIGALTTWTDVIRAELPPLFDGLKLAAREVGGVQIQNRGTLAGNICTASPAGDGAAQPAGARRRASSWRAAAAARVVPMRDFIDGYRHTAVPARRDRHRDPRAQAGSDGARSHFLKLGARKYLVISIVMVAGVIEIDADGRIAARAPRRRRLLGGAAAPAGAGGGAWSGSADRGAPDLVAQRASRSTCRRSTTSAARPPIAAQAALALTRDLLADLARRERRRAA